jgi:hypothetical protein
VTDTDLSGLTQKEKNKIARVILGGYMSDRNWATYWKAENHLRALEDAAGRDDIAIGLYEQCEWPDGRINVRKFARLVAEAIEDWKASDAGRAWIAANLQQADAGAV